MTFMKNSTKIFIGYAGCKVNQFEKNLLEEKLIDKGFFIADSWSDADIVIYNTCCVTKNAEYGCRQALRKIGRENQHAKIIVTGCYAQRDKEALLAIPNVILAVENKDKINIPEILSGEQFSSDAQMSYQYKRLYKDRARAFLKIQDGCDAFCSYCIVPFVRGKPVSMYDALVIKNLWHLREEKEVVLTGIHLGKWGIDTGKTLKDLMVKIAAEKYPFRLRLSSLEPNEITEGLLDVLKSMDNFCHHFHIPLQSGSDRILKLMNRNYDRKFFEKTIASLRKHFPYAGIGIDLIVGFPSETEEDFYEMLKFVSNLEIDYMHIFNYSDREGTKSFTLTPKVDKEKKSERSSMLKEIDLEKRKRFAERFIGKDVLALFDRKEGAFYRAVTREYLKVYSKDMIKTEEFRGRLISLKDGKPILKDP